MARKNTYRVDEALEEEFNLKQIDKYLWQLGKEKFPKKYY